MSASINFVNQREDNQGDGFRELRIKTQTDTDGYQSLNFVDGACWIESSVSEADLADTGMSEEEIAETIEALSETVCEHTLMSIRPDEEAEADDVSDLFVSEVLHLAAWMEKTRGCTRRCWSHLIRTSASRRRQLQSTQ